MLEQTDNSSSFDFALLNHHAVLHRFWTVPTQPADLNNSNSPVRFRQPQLGGYWKPNNCTPKCFLTNTNTNSSKYTSDCAVTVLVPFRGRSDNLAVFLPWMHTFLQDQQREYRIVLVEQVDNKLFNRAKLFNVAVTELHKLNLSPRSCYALHDIDKIPEDTRHIYECGPRPRHMMFKHRRSDDKARKYTPGRHYRSYVGGVLLVSDAQYKAVNGMSNKYFGWGREDDDLYKRFQVQKIVVDYASSEAGMYVIMAHGRDRHDNSLPWPFIKTVERIMQTDGLNSLDYQANVTFLPLYTLISASL